MFAKLSALLLAIPLVSALTLNTPTGATTGQSLTIYWTATTQDPSSFSIELVNPAFNDQYAVATNVMTALGQVTITLPQVNPGSDYQLQAIPISNSQTPLYTTPSFSIGVATTSSNSASSTASSASSSSAATVSTPSATTTSPISSVSSGSSAVSTAASSAASSTPSNFNSNGATGFKLPGMLPTAAVVLSAVAGAAMVF